MASFNFGQNSPKQARMATITNISNIIRAKKKKKKILILIFQIVLGIKLNQCLSNIVDLY